MGMLSRTLAPRRTSEFLSHIQMSRFKPSNVPEMPKKCNGHDRKQEESFLINTWGARVTNIAIASRLRLSEGQLVEENAIETSIADKHPLVH